MTGPRLTLVSSVPDFFAHGGTAAVDRGEGFGCNCANCGPVAWAA